MTRGGPAGPAGRAASFAWCLFDWANSAFPTVITTFVFATYFVKGIAPDETEGTVLWGRAMAIAGLAVAVLAPILGSVADRTGRVKPWLGGFTILCVVATAGLWWATPDPDAIPLSLVLVVLAVFGFECGMVFYNALLPGIAAEGRLGRLSGWGWGLGYMGGLGALVLALIGFVQTETPWFGVGEFPAGGVRATAPMVALWFALFALPLFLLVPEPPQAREPLGQAVSNGLARLWQTLKALPRTPILLRFLIARMLYTDGLTTLFAFGGIYAAGTFGFSLAEVIQFGIALNVTAGLGAAVFGVLDDRIGSRATILLALAGLVIAGIAVLLVTDVTLFWVFGMALGIFVGPAQAASRSFMARLAPPDERAELFGLYQLSGKATAFLGPLFLSIVTDATGSQRWGMATIILFFVVGGALLLTVREPRTQAAANG